MHLSIVIPTYNRARLLSATIPALANQDVSRDISYEVIFVVNGSTDESETLLKGAVEKYPGTFRYLCATGGSGPAHGFARKLPRE